MVRHARVEPIWLVSFQKYMFGAKKCITEYLFFVDRKHDALDSDNLKPPAKLMKVVFSQ